MLTRVLTQTKAVLRLTTYAEWMSRIGKKRRHDIYDSQRAGVEVRQVHPDEKFWAGLTRIVNEIPIRRGRAYSLYDSKPENIKNIFKYNPDPENTYFGAYHENELIGYLHLKRRGGVLRVAGLVVMERHFDKSPLKLLLDQSVRYACENGASEIEYGLMQRDGLGMFKKQYGFEERRVIRNPVEAFGAGVRRALEVVR